MHLRYYMYDSPLKEHPQSVMRNLGITYLFAVPQSMADQWWFIGCENVPDQLPEYIVEMQIQNPDELIGWGLTKEMAERLKNLSL